MLIAFTPRESPAILLLYKPTLIGMRTLANILADKPDFHIDLGDTFMTEKFAKTEKEVINRYVEERQFFDLIGHSVPLFLVHTKPGISYNPFYPPKQVITIARFRTKL